MEVTAWKFKKCYDFKIVETFAGDQQHKNLAETVLGMPPAWDQILTDTEKTQKEQLKKGLEGALAIRIGVYHDGELVAFTYAFQSETTNLHMAMSAVRPDHQRQGIYSELLRAVLEFSRKHGFQTVESFHRTTNNPVIIAKLRSGFVIGGVILSDIMGSLLRLVFHHNEDRRKLMDARCGLVRPTGSLRNLFF